MRKMSNSKDTNQSLYMIRIKEKISPQVLDWFEKAMVVTTEQNETIMACTIIDQAALHGVLSKIRDLNLTLISISKVELPENVLDNK
jgi:hypothetical protein